MTTGALLILGGGGHAAVVCESAVAAGWCVVGCLDDAEGAALDVTRVGIDHRGPIESLDRVVATLPDDAMVHAAIGDPVLRRQWLDRHERRAAPAVIDPTARVSPSARVAPGTYIGARAVINAMASIGRGAIVNTGAIVEHGCTLGPYCHVAPGAVLGGEADIGGDALVGLGAVVNPGIRIGASATLGAGAVAAADVPDGARAAGVPARAMRSRIVTEVAGGIGR